MLADTIREWVHPVDLRIARFRVRAGRFMFQEALSPSSGPPRSWHLDVVGGLTVSSSELLTKLNKSGLFLFLLFFSFCAEWPLLPQCLALRQNHIFTHSPKQWQMLLSYLALLERFVHDGRHRMCPLQWQWRDHLLFTKDSTAFTGLSGRPQMVVRRGPSSSRIPLQNLQPSRLICTDACQMGWRAHMDEFTTFRGVDETECGLLHQHSVNKGCSANPRCILRESWTTLLSWRWATCQ